MDRADLSGRARRLAEFFIKTTLMRRRTRCVFSNALRAAALRTLKIGANHMAEVVAKLEGARIVTVKAEHEGWEILVYPEFGGWNVKWLYLREEMASLLTAIECACGQIQGELLEPGPCLDRALSETSAENAALPVRTADVPKMGTRTPPVNCKASIKQLNTEQLNSVKQLSPAREGALMESLRQFVGDEDMVNWGGDWRKNWVRKMPDELERALDTLLDEIHKDQWRANKSRGAALKDLTRRYAGLIK